jgi:hypothetical protein
LPLTTQVSAPGLCGQWSASPVDLSSLTSSSDTASLVVRSDARDGVTVWITDREGGVTATAFTADGTVDGAPLSFPAPPTPSVDTESGDDGGSPPPPTVHDVEAVPGGWLVSWDGTPSAGWVGVYDATGNQLYTVSLATNAATIDLAPDGSIGINDGATIGWVPPGQWTEQIAVTYAPASVGTFTVDPGAYAAWNGGVAYVSAPDLSSNIETVAPGGVTVTFPGPALAYGCGDYDRILLPGVSGRSATVLELCPYGAASGVILDFASTAFPLRSFAFDGPALTSAPVAAAGRGPSAGLVLAWGSPASSSATALGFAEVAPTGARGAFVPLGNMPVAPTSLVMAGSSDGGAYFVIGWNGAVRAGYTARCVG